MSSNNGLTGWSCIYCGQALDGPQEGQEHQESGECPGPFPWEDDQVEYVQPLDLQPREPRPERPARTARTMPPRPMGDRPGRK
jgi:hypothetical protein